MRRRPGFTLVELLVVTLVIGILAAIGLARYRSISDRAYYSAMKSDLRGLSLDEELYFTHADVYSQDLDELDFASSAPGSTITVTFADRTGWAAYATHVAMAGAKCAMYYGGAPAEPPATEAGAIACDR